MPSHPAPPPTPDAPALNSPAPASPALYGWDRAAGAPLPVPTLTLRPKRVMMTLLVVVGTLVVLSCLARGFLASVPEDSFRGLREICYRFDLDRENTVPAWYSSIALLTCGGVLAVIACVLRQQKRPDVAYWVVLAITFAYLAIDESASLHEILIVPLRRRFDATGIFYFAWVVPGAIAVGLFALAYLRFLLRLPRRTAIGFMLSGATFVGGALGMELVGGALAESQGLYSASYTVVMTCEETLEMLGIVLFLGTLLDYLGRQAPLLRLQFAHGPAVS